MKEGMATWALNGEPPRTLRQLRRLVKATGQTHENDEAVAVVICQPSLPKMMGTLHPAGSLYEKPVNFDKAAMQHAAFRKRLTQHGAAVFDVHEMLTADTDLSVNARVELEDLAAKCLTYEFGDSGTAELSKQDKYYAGDVYKRKTLEALSADQLADIVLTRPTVTLLTSPRDTGLTANYSFEPLANLVFTRDQQITTRKGIVLASLASEQRRHEVDVMEFCFRKLGFNVIGRVPPPATLEGGDFYPAGEELCFIGTGIRTDQQAVDWLMSNDVFGTRRVAVVRDEYERRQDRMHLDTVFNILSQRCVLCLSDMMGESSPTRRLVDEYARDDGSGKYTKARSGVEFGSYLKSEGFHIIPVSAEEQLRYGCNMLNLGGGTLLSVNRDTSRRIVRDARFDGVIEYMDMSAITAMYGAMHCATQVVTRRAPEADADAVEW